MREKLVEGERVYELWGHGYFEYFVGLYLVSEVVFRNYEKKKGKLINCIQQKKWLN